MRHNELSEGVDVLDDKGNVVGSSKIAARNVSNFLASYKTFVFESTVNWGEPIRPHDVHNTTFSSRPQAIMETAFTRVVLPMPIFVLPPIIMSYLERYAAVIKNNNAKYSNPLTTPKPLNE